MPSICGRAYYEYVLKFKSNKSLWQSGGKYLTGFPLVTKAIHHQ